MAEGIGAGGGWWEPEAGGMRARAVGKEAQGGGGSRRWDKGSEEDSRVQGETEGSDEAGGGVQEGVVATFVFAR